MDIKTLSERTGIPVRQIRYIIDNEMVPDGAWSVDDLAVGRARSFTDSGAIYVTCAALLLNAGYKRDSITNLMRVVTMSVPVRVPEGWMPQTLSFFDYIVARSGTGRLQYADGLYSRWLTDDYKSEWIEVAKPNAANPNLIPKVLLELNIGEIRDLVLGENQST